MPRIVNPYRDAQHQRRLWTPAHLTMRSMAAWYDASDLSTISIATGVSEWRDKSGKGNHLVQTNASLQPAYSHRLGRIELNGTTQYMDKTSPTVDTGNIERSIVYAGLIDSSLGTNTGHLFGCTSGEQSYGINGLSGSAAQMAINSGWNWTTRHNNGYTEPVASAANGTFSNTASIFVSRYTTQHSSSTYRGRGQEAPYYTSANPTNTVTLSTSLRMFFGAYITSVPVTYTAGRVYTAFLFNTRLTTREYELIEGWIAWNPAWQLAGFREVLVPTHPFKNRPPLIGD